MAIIEVEAVSKTFRIPGVRRDTLREHVLDRFRPREWTTLPVLQSVSFAVRQGETLGVMGRNGCGKSTLLKILSGIYQPDSGHLMVRAPITPILELGVGWNPELDAIDNIYLLGTVMGLSLREVDAAIDEILAFAELERFANLKLKHFSSGMAARLAYAVAFSAVNEILVLDEIFAVGDAGFKAKCVARFNELRGNGHTVVLVSHDIPIVRSFCTRVLLLEKGRVIADAGSAEVCDLYLSLLTDPESHG
jgi:ABC-type polysaccharide/polyol phosphate transport system ATPase subunit